MRGRPPVTVLAICPRCGQDPVVSRRVAGTRDLIAVCEECEAVGPEPIDDRTATLAAMLPLGRGLLAIVAAGTVALAACGADGAKSERDAVIAATRRLVTAEARSDAASFCTLITDRRVQGAAYPSSIAYVERPSPQDGCRTNVGIDLRNTRAALARSADPVDEVAAIRSAVAQDADLDVAVHADRASVVVRGRPGSARPTATIRLAKEHGRWLVDSGTPQTGEPDS